MLGGLIQSTAKNFLSLKYGTDKTVKKLETSYFDLVKNGRDKICKRKNDDIQRKVRNIITQLQSLLKLIRSLLSVLKKILKFVKVIKKLLIGLTILVKILKLFPLPARWAIVGMIIKMGDLLNKISFQLKSALLIILGIDFTITYLNKSLSFLVKKIDDLIKSLQVVSQQLKDCASTNENNADDLLNQSGLDRTKYDGLDLGNLQDGNGSGGVGNDRALSLLNQAALQRSLAGDLDSSLNDLSAGLRDLKNQMGELLNSNNTYKGFTFKIIEEETVQQVVAKRRYAVAINIDGIVTLTGELSYATDTKVLIDELKLRIDTDNLTGYTSIKTSNTVISDIDQPVSTGVVIDTSNIKPEDEDIINLLNQSIEDNQNGVGEQEVGDVDEEIGMQETNNEVLNDLGYESETEIEEDADSAISDLEDLLETDTGEKKMKSKYNSKQQKFIRMLQRKASNGDAKAKELLARIQSGQVKVKDAKAEWYLMKG
jgi:hypothetical protein